MAERQRRRRLSPVRTGAPNLPASLKTQVSEVEPTQTEVGSEVVDHWGKLWEELRTQSAESETATPSWEDSVRHSFQLHFDRKIADRMFKLLITEHRRVSAAAPGENRVGIMAARRMLSVVMAAMSVGMPLPENGRFVSSRFLPLEPRDKWRDADYCWLDEGFFKTGIAKAEQRGPQKGRWHTEAKAYQLLKALTDSDSSLKELQDPDCSGHKHFQAVVSPVSYPKEADRKAAQRRINRQIAAQNGFTGTPLLSDFPISRQVPLSLQEFQDLSYGAGWFCAGVNNAAVDPRYVTLRTLIPDKEMERKLRAALGAASQWVEVIKFRIFSTRDGSTEKVRIAPVVLCRPATCDSMAQILEGFGIELGDNTAKVYEGKTLRDLQLAAGYGLCGYILAAKLLEAVKLVDPNMQVFDIDQDFTKLQLGSLWDTVYDNSGQLRTETFQQATKIKSGSRRCTDSAVQQIQKQFGTARYLTIRDERKLRALFNQEDPPGMKKTYSFDYVCETAEAAPHYVSLLLDVYNDMGAAVPKLHIDVDKAECRRDYGHGEGRKGIDNSPLHGRYSAYPPDITFDDEQ